MISTSVFLLLLLFLIPIVSLRVLSLLPTRQSQPRSRTSHTPTRLLVVLGSGGHTAEMFSLLHSLDTLKYTHRSYVVSSGDAFSALKAKEFERGLYDTARARASAEKKKLRKGVADAGDQAVTKEEVYGNYDIEIVPRARKIYQSLLTTPISSLQCLFACFSILMSTPSVSEVKLGYPDLIVSNGPATAVIVVFASFVLRFLGLPGTSGKMRTIYVESWARVRKLSLSGKILLRVVDRFLVQWERLAEELGGQAEYIGVLVSH
jgi:beta-1,4-N-acetylglucosaminyltransferase